MSVQEVQSKPRLAKKAGKEILIFPSMVGITGKFWEIKFHADKMIYGNTFMYAIISISERKAI